LLHTPDKQSGVAFLTAPRLLHTPDKQLSVAFLTALGCYTACLTLKNAGAETPPFFFFFVSLSDKHQRNKEGAQVHLY
jgi:hypothetical protein